MINTAFRPATPKFVSMPSPFHLLNDVLNTTVDELYHNYNGLVNKRPPVNIKETKDGFEIALAAPGLEKGDFNLSFEKNNLIVSVKKDTATVEGERIVRKEFGYHDFTHSFTIAEVLDTKSINATYTNGILTIKLAKKPEVPVQKITID
jgi:HSP20 family protein